MNSVYLKVFTPLLLSIEMMERTILTILLSLLNLSIAAAQTSNAVTPTEEKLDSLLDASFDYLKKKPRKSQRYLREALNLSNEETSQSMLFKLHINFGLTYYYLGAMDSSIFYYQRSLEHAKALQSKPKMAIAFKNMGISYRAKSLYTKAIEKYQEALTIYQGLNNEKSVASVNNSIGIIYSSTRDYDKAIQYFDKALESWKEAKDSLRISKVYNNLGISYKGIGDFDKAITFYKSSLQFNRSNDKAMNNLAEALIDKNKIDLASTYLLEALEIRKESGDKNGEASTLSLMGELSRKRGRYNDAYEYLDLSEQLLSETGDKSLLLENYQIRKKSLQDQGKFAPALLLADKIYSLDSLLFKQQKIGVLELQAFYDIQEKENEKQLLEQENEIIKINQEKQKIALGSTLITLFLLVIIAGILWYTLRAINNKNKLLQANNKLIQSQKSEIGHRNANGLNRIVLLIRNLLRDHENEATKRELHQVEKMVFGLANLESHLYLNNEDQESAEAKPFLEKLVRELDRSFKLPDQVIVYELEIKCHSIPVDLLTIVSLIVTELIINALKHAFQDKEGKIVLILQKEDSYLLSLSDNGIGIDEPSFRENKGLRIIENLTRQAKGEFSIQSSAEGGTLFDFSFPVKEPTTVKV